MSQRTRLALILATIGTLALVVPAIAGVTAAPDFSPIAGAWGAHGISVEIGNDGQAVAHWRIYTWCNTVQQPAPCDSIIGDSIEDGGLAMLSFTTFNGTTATGVVLMSSDTTGFSPGSTVVLQTMRGGVAQMQAIGGSPILLCGPAFDPTAFTTSPCGA
jgi:hypothetical protein